MSGDLGSDPLTTTHERVPWFVVHRLFLTWVVLGAVLKFIPLAGLLILYFVGLFAVLSGIVDLSGGPPSGGQRAVFLMVTGTLALAFITIAIHKARHLTSRGVVSPPMLGLPVGIASPFAVGATLRLLADLGGHFWRGTPCYACSGPSYLLLGTTMTVSVGCIILYRRLTKDAARHIPS